MSPWKNHSTSARRSGCQVLSGVLQNGHWAYILQGNLFHDFLEECVELVPSKAFTIWEGKIVKQIFPSQDRPNVHFAELHFLPDIMAVTSIGSSDSTETGPGAQPLSGFIERVTFHSEEPGFACCASKPEAVAID